MTPSDKTVHYRWRLASLLAKAGPTGMTRTAIGKTTDASNRPGLLAELDRFYGDGHAETVGNRWRLTLPAADAMRTFHPEAVALFFDLDSPDGRAFRRWRIDTYGADVVMLPGSPPVPCEYPGTEISDLPAESAPRLKLADSFHTRLTPEPEAFSAAGFWE